MTDPAQYPGTPDLAIGFLRAGGIYDAVAYIYKMVRNALKAGNHGGIIRANIRAAAAFSKTGKMAVTPVLDNLHNTPIAKIMQNAI